MKFISFHYHGLITLHPISLSDDVLHQGISILFHWTVYICLKELYWRFWSGFWWNFRAEYNARWAVDLVTSSRVLSGDFCIITTEFQLFIPQESPLHLILHLSIQSLCRISPFLYAILWINSVNFVVFWKTSLILW